MTLIFCSSDRFRPEKRKFQGIFFIIFIQTERRFQQSFNHIATVSGCGRELNAHLKSAASLTYHTSGTWRDIPPSHNKLTPDRPVPLSQCWTQTKDQLIQIFKAFGMTRPGNLPDATGGSSNWATKPVGSKVIGLLISTDFTITEPAHDKTKKMAWFPGKNQINMGISPVWSVFTVHSMGC